MCQIARDGMSSVIWPRDFLKTRARSKLTGSVRRLTTRRSRRRLSARSSVRGPPATGSRRCRSRQEERVQAQQCALRRPRPSECAQRLRSCNSRIFFLLTYLSTYCLPTHPFCSPQQSKSSSEAKAALRAQGASDRLRRTRRPQRPNRSVAGKTSEKLTRKRNGRSEITRTTSRKRGVLDGSEIDQDGVIQGLIGTHKDKMRDITEEAGSRCAPARETARPNPAATPAVVRRAAGEPPARPAHARPV